MSASGPDMLTILEIEAGEHDLDLARARALAGAPDVRLILVVPDRGTWTHAHGHDLLIEHLEAPMRPGSRRRRALIDARRLRELVQLHRPAALVSRSPLAGPVLSRLAGFRLDPRPAWIGSWHDDDDDDGRLQRELERIDPRLARLGERATAWGRERGLASYDAVLVDSHDAARRLLARGIDRLYVAPRGVDLELFSPAHRDERRVAALRAGRDRPILALRHGVEIDAGLVRRLHAALCRRLPHDPAVVLIGPNSEPLERFTRAHAHVHASAGDDPNERSRDIASCDLALVIPGPEGARAACLEAMACGVPIVVAGPSARIDASGCGRAGVEARARPLAEAALELLGAGEAAELGARGRRFAGQLELGHCTQRELACYREIIEHVRGQRRVAPGIHERRQPTPLEQ